MQGTASQECVEWWDTDNGQQIGGVKEATLGKAQGWGGQAPNLV